MEAYKFLVLYSRLLLSLVLTLVLPLGIVIFSHSLIRTGIASTMKAGVIVRLAELRQPDSPHCAHDQSLRVLGLLESYVVKSGIAVITDAGTSLRVDTQHLRDLSLCPGCLYEFIGELSVEPVSQMMTLKARVGRNIEGRDVKLFDKALQLRRTFEKEHTGEVVV